MASKPSRTWTSFEALPANSTSVCTAPSVGIWAWAEWTGAKGVVGGVMLVVVVVEAGLGWRC